MWRGAVTAMLLVITALSGGAARHVLGLQPIRAELRGAAVASQAAGYWTDDRMQRAQQADDLAAMRAAQRPQFGIRPSARRLTAVAPPVAKAAAWRAGGGVSRAVGRVFFTLGGRDYACTGTAVASGNRDTVVTAGHCVNAGPGAYAHNWVFVPGYRNGSRPYGTWTARRLLAPAAWVGSGSTPDDVGFAVVGTRGGRHLTDVVGAMRIAFGAPRGVYAWAFGYPVGSPSLGRYVVYCRGTLRRDPYGTAAQGMGCSMAGGSSGGPWLVGLSASTGAGTVYAVTSFSYRGMAGVVWAPYLGATAAALYRTAQRA
jgi:V8-like Glu-specific endopeptidase